MIGNAKTLSAAEVVPGVWQVSHLSAAKNERSGLFERLRHGRSGLVAEMLICFTDVSLWFSLPLTIWLTTGWVGLIFHWRAISKMVCQMENAPQDAMPGGAAACRPLS